MASRHVLILYYSLTQQTPRVLKHIDEGLKAAGHTTEWKAIDPIDKYPLPIGRMQFLWINAKLWAGLDLNPRLMPMEFEPAKYDHIILGFQTWHLEPSFPMNAFLDASMSSMLSGKKVTLVQTCRNRWSRAQRIVIDKVLRRGGRVVSAYVLSNPDGHLLPTLHYLWNGKDPDPGTKMADRVGKDFAFEEKDVATARTFGDKLAIWLDKDEFPPRAEWTVVNNQE